MAAFVASGQEGGLQYNVGAIYGAGLFVTTIVIGLISLSQVEIKLASTRWGSYR